MALRTRLVVLLALLIAVTLSTGALAQSPGRTPTDQQQTYTVVSGDTLSRIAARYGVTVAELAAENDIINPSQIRVGEVLVIPSDDTPTSLPAPTRVSMPRRSALTVARVTDVVDGDTIKVRIGSSVYTVRYIGVDTPETVHPSRPVEWMGPEASAANKELVDGELVYLEKDISETDKYDRLLRYVWLPDGTLVNDELCRLGYAQVSTYPPDVKYTDVFLAAVAEAREAERGLWGSASSTPTATATRSAGAPVTSYVVKAGDNLSAIARTLGCSLVDLCSYNNIADPGMIRVGQVIQLPPAGYVAPTWTPAPPTATPVPVVAATATPAPLPTIYIAPTSAPVRTCCRICTTGKACGDSCINRNYTCRQPPGCACNAY